MSQGWSPVGKLPIIENQIRSIRKERSKARNKFECLDKPQPMDSVFSIESLLEGGEGQLYRNMKPMARRIKFKGNKTGKANSRSVGKLVSCVRCGMNILQKDRRLHRCIPHVTEVKGTERHLQRWKEWKQGKRKNQSKVIPPPVKLPHWLKDASFVHKKENLDFIRFRGKMLSTLPVSLTSVIIPEDSARLHEMFHYQQSFIRPEEIQPAVDEELPIETDR